MRKFTRLLSLLILLAFTSACSIGQVSDDVDPEQVVTSTSSQITPTAVSSISTLTPTPAPTSTEIIPKQTEVLNWDFDYSSPEEQGISQDLLDEMQEIISEQYPAVDSILIVRNGKIILDLHQNSFKDSDVHRIYSGTKSILSILVGIAIDQGYIESVDVHLLDFFQDKEINYSGEMKGAITLEHLMTMTSGMQCLDADTYGLDWWVEFMGSPNWVSTFLDQPMNAVPGEEFYYCDGSANLVSAILQDSVGMSLYTFAEQYLFTPLGIDELYWHQVGGGYYNGSTGVHILPKDYAKIGSLLLTGGRWQGEQIVSEEWIASSTSKYIEGSFTDWYGYYWWVDEEGYISAFGLGNQLLYVIPEENLIVVIFSQPEEGRYYDIYAEDILEDLILPVLKN